MEFRGRNNYGPPPSSYEPRPNFYVEPVGAVGYGPGYRRGMGMRGGFGCDMCGRRRRCRCDRPGLLGGRRQGLLSTVIGGTISMMEDRHRGQREERLMQMQYRMEEDMRYARERGLETRAMQSQTRSRSAVREDGRDSEKDIRNRDRQGARAHSEDDSDDEDRGGRMDKKHGLKSDERQRQERMDEKLPSYQAATKKN